LLYAIDAEGSLLWVALCLQLHTFSSKSKPHLLNFDGPAVVIVGAHDPMFNPKGTVTAAREGLSSLGEAISLPDEGHIFGPDGVEFLRGAATELFERPAG
jgi:pimeloyl-ACP methyl ester carboxylesterase